MKKFMSIVLALMLLMALSAPTMASAVGQEAGAATAINGTGTTVVSVVFASDGQVSATVPLTVTLAVGGDGAVTGPSGYTITNTSALPIKVSNVTITPKAGFTTDSAGTGTRIGAITLTDGASGSATALSSWTAAKTATAWNMAVGGSITMAFAGAVSNIQQDLTSATAAFDVVFTIVAGNNT